MAVFVNKVEIKDGEIAQEMQYHAAETREEAWFLATQSLVIRQLLLQQAVDTGLCEDPDTMGSSSREEDVIERLLQQDVTVPEADKDTCRRFYDMHPDSFIDDGTGQRAPFTRTHAKIRDYLHTKAMRIALAEYIKALSHNASIKGFELDAL